MIKRINSYFFGEEFTTGDLLLYWGCLFGTSAITAATVFAVL